MTIRGKTTEEAESRIPVSIVLVIACWIIGTFWAFKPTHSESGSTAGIISLNSAQLKRIGTDQVFFQLGVDPIRQQDWQRSLELKPIDPGNPVYIPLFHTMDTWEQPRGFVRPPYADSEVKDWSALHSREVKNGFSRTWPDGSIIILDMGSDFVIGWAKIETLQDILN